MEFVGEPLERACLFHGIEILALEVLNQRHLQCHLIANIANNCGHPSKLGPLRGSPPAFAGYELVAVSDSPNDQRLNNAAGADRARKLVQGYFAESCSWLERARIDQVDVDLREDLTRSQDRCCRRCSRSHRLCRWNRRLRLMLLGFRLPDQGAQSPAQRVSGHWQ